MLSVKLGGDTTREKALCEAIARQAARLATTLVIAAGHYVQVTNADFQRAVSGGSNYGTVSSGKRLHGAERKTKTLTLFRFLRRYASVYECSGGEDRIRTCGPGLPGHRFSKPAL